MDFDVAEKADALSVMIGDKQPDFLRIAFKDESAFARYASYGAIFVHRLQSRTSKIAP